MSHIKFSGTCRDCGKGVVRTEYPDGDTVSTHGRHVRCSACKTTNWLTKTSAESPYQHG